MTRLELIVYVLLSKCQLIFIDLFKKILGGFEIRIS